MYTNLYLQSYLKIAKMLHFSKNFATKIRKNPRAMLEEYGIMLAAKTDINVVEDHHEYMHFVIIQPFQMNQELSGDIITHISAAGNDKPHHTIGPVATGSSVSSFSSLLGESTLSTIGSVLTLSTAGSVSNVE